MKYTKPTAIPIVPKNIIQINIVAPSVIIQCTKEKIQNTHALRPIAAPSGCEAPPINKIKYNATANANDIAKSNKTS